MGHDEIKTKAKKRVEAKKAFYIVAMIFAAVSVILLVLALAIPVELSVRFWLLFPILIFCLVLGIMYLSIFGIPGSNVLSRDWEEREMSREMRRLYRQEGGDFPTDTELNEADRLELKELQRLKQKWEDNDEYV